MIPEAGMIVAVHSNDERLLPGKLKIVGFLSLKDVVVYWAMILEKFERSFVLLGDAAEFFIFGFRRFQTLCSPQGVIEATDPERAIVVQMGAKRVSPRRLDEAIDKNKDGDAYDANAEK